MSETLSQYLQPRLHSYASTATAQSIPTPDLQKAAASVDGARGARIVDTDGCVWTLGPRVSSDFQTFCNGAHTGAGSAVGYLFWKQKVYVWNSESKWYVWGPGWQGVDGDPSVKRVSPVPTSPIVITPVAPQPQPLSTGSLRAELRGDEARLATHPDVYKYFRMSRNTIANGLINFTNGIDRIEAYKRWPEQNVDSVRLVSIGRNPDGSSYLDMTLASWKHQFAGKDEVWLCSTIMIDPDVKDGMTELGIKLHGFASWSHDAIPSAVTWIGKVNRATSPASYPLQTYEYWQGQTGYGQLFPTGAALVEGRIHTIDLHLKMNTPGKADGIHEVWLDDRRVFLDNTARFRADVNVLWDIVLFQIYHGGMGRPAKPIHVEVGPVVLSKRRVGMLQKKSAASTP